MKSETDLGVRVTSSKITYDQIRQVFDNNFRFTCLPSRWWASWRKRWDPYSFQCFQGLVPNPELPPVDVWWVKECMNVWGEDWQGCTGWTGKEWEVLTKMATVAANILSISGLPISFRFPDVTSAWSLKPVVNTRAAWYTVSVLRTCQLLHRDLKTSLEC